MKISASEGYHGRRDGCAWDECIRQYCKRHRLLWSMCETVKRGVDDYYMSGRPHYVFEPGDCPECEQEFRRKVHGCFIASQRN
jgi:hypothetical protein